VRKELKFGEGREYKPEIEVFRWWSFQHRQPGMGFAFPGATNDMSDLAMAMKYNPQLKVLLNAGYFDLATPFYEGVYEMQHLPIPSELQNNIEYQFYESGHMVYAHEASLKAVHDNVAAFILKSSNARAK
jgi:carboxypeptidase C (cathepsin A)